VFALSLFLAGGAQAAAVSFSTAEFVTIRDCVAGPNTACDSVSPLIQSAYGGSPGAPSSSATTALATHGSAFGSVALSGTVGAPVLATSAFSLPGTRTNTNSFALQRYTYTGGTSALLNFGGTLTYAQFSTGTYPVGPGGGVSASIAIFTLPTDTVEVGDTAESNFLALQGISTVDGYAQLGGTFYNDSMTNPAGVGLLSVDVAVNPGDTFWVWVRLQTPATNGGWVDASHTLITYWDDPTNLVPAVSVPEPHALVLAAVAIALCGAQRIRDRLRARAGA